MRTAQKFASTGDKKGGRREVIQCWQRGLPTQHDDFRESICDHRATGADRRSEHGPRWCSRAWIDDGTMRSAGDNPVGKRMRGTGEGGVGQRETREGLRGIERASERDGKGFAAQRAEIAASIDQRTRNSARAEHSDRPVHRKSFGNAAEIKTHSRVMEAHTPPSEQRDVFEAGKAAAISFASPLAWRQKSELLQPWGDADIEHALGDSPHRLRQFQYCEIQRSTATGLRKAF